MIRLNFNKVPNKTYPTKQEILKRVNEEQIVRYFLNEGALVFNKAIKSPLREDNNPSFAFFATQEGKICWKDFATGESGDAFSFVMKKYNVNFHEALGVIYRNMIESFTTKQELNVKTELDYRLKQKSYKVKKNKPIITIKTRKWDIYDYNYWTKDYGLDLSLVERFNVKPIVKYSISKYSVLERKYMPFKHKKALMPTYAYKFDNGVYKIYAPLSKEIKWLAFNGSKNNIEGYHMLPNTGELLIITKSLKDCMVLYKYGIPAISFQGEFNIPSTKTMDEFYNRFENIILLLDNDRPGRKAARKFKKYYPELHKRFLTREKDISDVYYFHRHRGVANELTKLCSSI